MFHLVELKNLKKIEFLTFNDIYCKTSNHCATKTIHATKQLMSRTFPGALYLVHNCTNLYIYCIEQLILAFVQCKHRASIPRVYNSAISRLWPTSCICVVIYVLYHLATNSLFKNISPRSGLIFWNNARVKRVRYLL